MGHPKKLRKRWEKPKKLFDKSRIERERKLVRIYGFKRKREIWKMEYLFKNYKRRARSILANYKEDDKRILVNKLAGIGVLSKDASLDDVLNLDLENFLDRRLQTIVHKKGLANTIKEARQLITHKKVFVGDRIIDQPNYIVSVNEENNIKLKEKIKKPKKEESQAGDQKPEEIKEKPEGAERTEQTEEKQSNEQIEGTDQKEEKVREEESKENKIKE